MSIKPVKGLVNNFPRTPEEIDQRIKETNDSELKKQLLLEKRNLIKARSKEKELAKQEELAKKNANYQIKQRKVTFKRNNHGNSSLIKRFTFSKINEKVNRMINGSTSSVYASRIAHWITKGWGESEVPLKNIKNNSFFYSINKIYTNDSVKMPLVIYSWGEMLPVAWLDDLRNDLIPIENTYNIQNETNLHISINHISHNQPSELSFNDSKRLQNDYKRVLNTVTSDSVNDIDLNNYIWLQDIESENFDSLWNSREFIEIVISNGPSGKTAELLHEVYDFMIKKLKILGMKTKDMYLMVQNYYDEFSPIGHRHERGPHSALRHKYIAILRSGEMITSSGQLESGSISDRQGVPVGIDINSEKPILINYADNSLPPSTIIAATTGAGKTFLIQSIIIGFLVNHLTYFPIIIDYKNEYTDLGKAAGMQIISSSPSDGLYYDTMEIGEPTGDPEIDARMRDNSINTTDNVFEILIGKDWDELKHVYEYVRRSLYHRQDVYFNKPETWKNSKGLTYHTFYNEISHIISFERKQAEEEADISEFIKLKKILSEYFEVDGSKASYFRQPIRMKDINESKGVIFALDQTAVNTISGSIDTKLALTMQFILHILNNLTDRKTDKRIIPIFWEETNQLLLIPKVAKMISSLTTGGRSRGIRNFFITNSPSQIFNAETESKFSEIDPSLISTILNNALSIIVGKNSQDEMDAIAKRYHLDSETAKIYLNLLTKENTQDNNDTSALSHKFIIRHRNHLALMQAITNPILNELGVFGTEVNVNQFNVKKQKDVLIKELMKNDDSINHVDNVLNNDKNIIKGLVNKDFNKDK